MSEVESLPRWILFYGGFLAFVGLTVGAIGVVSPALFFNDFPSFDRWREIAFITTGWGIRGVTGAAAMIVALFLRAPAAIAAVFTMRFLTESGDLLNTLATGHGNPGAPWIVLVVIWFGLFLVPEALAARWGFARTRA